MLGQCRSQYLVIGNYCNLSCGRCNATAADSTGAAAPADGQAQPRCVQRATCRRKVCAWCVV